MIIEFAPLLMLTLSLAQGKNAISVPATEFWENGGEYLHLLLHDGDSDSVARAATRLRTMHRNNCAKYRQTNYTPISAARESGARAYEFDMIDHAQSLTQKQQYEFISANRRYDTDLLKEKEKVTESWAGLSRTPSPASRIALELAAREACENITNLQLAAAEKNAYLTKKSGLDRDYAYRAFFREYRRKLAY